jgi:hypothetical protein
VRDRVIEVRQRRLALACPDRRLADRLQQRPDLARLQQHVRTRALVIAARLDHQVDEVRLL